MRALNFVAYPARACHAGPLRQQRPCQRRRLACPRTLLAVLLTACCAVSPAPADDAKKTTSPQQDANELSLEVTALQTLYQFQLTQAQMNKLHKHAKETVEKNRKRQEAQASKEFRDKLLELRKALVSATDDDLIDQLSDELEDLRSEEKPVLDDEIKITPEARKRAPELLRVLKANQYAAYTALLTELSDPLELLTESLAKVRDLKKAEWRDQRKKVAAEIGRLVGGVDAAKEEKISKAVTTLLTRARKLSAVEFEEQREALEKEAGQLIGDISPADVIRNEIEYTIAELLTNPRLLAALAARLQL
jgi:hypothetical protein